MTRIHFNHFKYTVQLGTLTSLYTELQNHYHYPSWERLTLWDPMDCGPVHGISQERTLEWVAISSSRGSSPPSYQSWVSSIAGRFFTAEPPGKPKIYMTCSNDMYYFSHFKWMIQWHQEHWRCCTLNCITITTIHLENLRTFLPPHTEAMHSWSNNSSYPLPSSNSFLILKIVEYTYHKIYCLNHF